MSTSILYHAFGVSGVKYLATDYSASKITFHAKMTHQCLQCPKYSGCHFKFRGNDVRHFHMIPFGKKPYSSSCGVQKIAIIFTDLLFHLCQKIKG